MSHRDKYRMVALFLFIVSLMLGWQALSGKAFFTNGAGAVISLILSFGALMRSRH